MTRGLFDRADLPFTIEDKIKELELELRYRERVYPRLIDRQMTRRRAETRIGIMTAILEDYRALQRKGATP